MHFLWKNAKNIKIWRFVLSRCCKTHGFSIFIIFYFCMIKFLYNFMIFVKFIHKPQKLFVMFSNGIRSLSSCSKLKEFPTVCDWKLFYFLVVFSCFLRIFIKFVHLVLYISLISDLKSSFLHLFTIKSHANICMGFVLRLLLKKALFWQKKLDFGKK